MKKIFISLIKIYQKFISPALLQLLGVKNACRFEVSCSEYAKRAIQNKGVLKGTYLSVLRVLKCQPFYKLS